MLFNSQIFIFLFLPLALSGWFFINRLRAYRCALLFLVGMSLWFYGYFNPRYLAIILVSIGFNYSLSFVMDRLPGDKVRRICCLVGCVGNVGLLGYYKYYDFFLDNLNTVFHTDFPLKNIILPLGISFFTLQQLSFVIDRSRGEAGHLPLLDYAAFVTFFPQLIAGPIVLHSELIPQLQDLRKRTFSAEDFADGIVLFCLGLMKKVLLADTLAMIVNQGFEKIYWLDTPSAWLVALCFTFELYLDFSGYCDMAMGIGKMFRMDLPVNFNSPYKAHSGREYWKRWHITLTRFFTKYVYIPLGGSRRGTARTILNILIVFLISGLWHGASWTFVIWGLLHGLSVAWSHRKHFRLKDGWLSWACMFLYTIPVSAIFRSETVDNMCRILKAMFVPSFTGFFPELTSAVKQLSELYVPVKLLELKDPYLMNYFCPAVVFVLLAVTAFVLHGKNTQELLASQKEKGFTRSFTLFLVVFTGWALISLTQVSTFLYFNF